MSASGAYQIRRATTDDLDKLIVLWRASGLPSDDLEKQFTEFQVAESREGQIVGAIAMQIAGTDGRIHSEAYSDFSLSNHLRPLFWARLEVVARNHGLFRVWTTETAPFWKKEAGFSAPTTRPPELFAPANDPWLALRLKEEGADPALLEAQFTLFREAERAKREKLMQSASALKMFGTLVAVVVFIFSVMVLFWFIRHRA